MSNVERTHYHIQYELTPTAAESKQRYSRSTDRSACTLGSVRLCSAHLHTQRLGWPTLERASFKITLCASRANRPNRLDDDFLYSALRLHATRRLPVSCALAHTLTRSSSSWSRRSTLAAWMHDSNFSRAQFLKFPQPTNEKFSNLTKSYWTPYPIRALTHTICNCFIH